MDASDVCPTEDAIHTFFEYLVDPILPAKSSLRDIPSLPQQESVAKQVHAVVLLYNYYHRKQCPKLEVLDFDSFCKLVVGLKPALLAHMKFMQKSSSGIESDDLEKQLSLTEKTIMDACKISLSLDASKDVPNTEGWPISKVAVLLIDAKKENCFLLFSSITQGVWSVIEKDLDVTDHSSEDTTEAKHVNKKKRVTREPSRGESSIDEASFQKIAYSAVSEATGINQTDLLVLESHVVFSVSKEKAAACFFIIQCTQSVNEDIIQVPIKDVIDSLQGPLVQKSSSSWTPTAVVEYFHVLPYAGILLEWFYRREFSNGLQNSRLQEGNVNVRSPKRIERPCKPEIHKSQETSPVNGVTIEDLKNNTCSSKPQSWKQKDTTGCCKTGLADAFDGPQKIEVNDSSRILSQKPEIQKRQDKSHVNGVMNRMIQDLRNNTSSSKPQSWKQKDTTGCCKTGLADAFNGPQKIEVNDSSRILSQKPEIQKRQDKSHVNGIMNLMIEDLRINTSSSKPQSWKQKDTTGCCKTGLADAFNGPQKIVVNDSSMVPLQKPEIHKSQDKSNVNGVMIEDLRNNTSSSKPQSWKEKDTIGSCKTGLADAFDGPQEIVVNDSSMVPLQKPEIHKSQDKSNVNGVMIEDLGNNTSSFKPQSWKEKDTNGSCKTGSADAFNGPQIDDSSMVPSKNGENCKKYSSTIQVFNHQEKISCIGSELNGSASNVKFDMVNLTTRPFITECRPENVIAGNKICSINSSDQDSIGGHALVTSQSNSKDLHKLQSAIASKENILSQTALNVLMKRRDELSLQQRNIQDEMARCDKKIQTILNGGEDDLALKLESIIEGCDAFLRSERTHRPLEDQCSPQNIKRKRLSEAVLNMQNPCQELDGVCYENNWILPTYHVSSSDGGFQANVMVKGMDFECSRGGDLCSSPRQARESAAAQTLVKLRSIAGHAQT